MAQVGEREMDQDRASVRAGVRHVGSGQIVDQLFDGGGSQALLCFDGSATGSASNDFFAWSVR